MVTQWLLLCTNQLCPYTPRTLSKPKPQPGPTLRFHALLCRIQLCSRHMLPWYHLLLTRKDDKTITLLQLGDSALGCAGGTELSWFNTASLNTAQSHWRVRTPGSQGSSWLPISEAGKMELCLPPPARSQHLSLQRLGNHLESLCPSLGRSQP